MKNNPGGLSVEHIMIIEHFHSVYSEDSPKTSQIGGLDGQPHLDVGALLATVCWLLFGSIWFRRWGWISCAQQEANEHSSTKA